MVNITIGQASSLLEQMEITGFIYHGNVFNKNEADYSFIFDKLYDKGVGKITQLKKSYFLHLLWKKDFKSLEIELDNLI